MTRSPRQAEGRDTGDVSGARSATIDAMAPVSIYEEDHQSAAFHCLLDIQAEHGGPSRCVSATEKAVDGAKCSRNRSFFH
jgi:hypothetical protein